MEEEEPGKDDSYIHEVESAVKTRLPFRVESPYLLSQIHKHF